MAGQDVEPGDTEGTWRIAENVAPDRVISTVDPEARHMHTSQSTYRDDYKAHVAVEPDTGIITAVSLTAANAADGPTGVALLEKEQKGLEVLADSAYGSREAGPPWPRHPTTPSSSRSRFVPLSRAGFRSTTSPSTPPPVP